MPSRALQTYHKQNLEVAKRSIDEVAVEYRDISAVTIAINPAQLSEAKKNIQQFRIKMARLLACDHPTEVYTLAIQLFPVTRHRNNAKSHE